MEREREIHIHADLFLAVGITDCGAIVDNKVVALALLHNGLHEAIRIRVVPKPWFNIEPVTTFGESGHDRPRSGICIDQYRVHALNPRFCIILCTLSTCFYINV
jgi:hypothetical protein